jgi:hypothetical protein
VRFKYLSRNVLRGQGSLTAIFYRNIWGFFDREVARDYCVVCVSVIVFRIYSAGLQLESDAKFLGDDRDACRSSEVLLVLKQLRIVSGAFVKPRHGLRVLSCVHEWVPLRTRKGIGGCLGGLTSISHAVLCRKVA